MLRLIHAQTGLGGIVIDDIDDGLPNKEVHRLGSTADPKAYPRDGYANSPKQPCYIPYANPSNTAQAGYIDLSACNRDLSCASVRTAPLWGNLWSVTPNMTGSWNNCGNWIPTTLICRGSSRRNSPAAPKFATRFPCSPPKKRTLWNNCSALWNGWRRRRGLSASKMCSSG